METINLDKGLNCNIVTYPDGQPHVRVWGVQAGDEVRVVCALRNGQDLLKLLELSNALNGVFVQKKELVIPYLLGARSDRRMMSGDSVDLKVIADMINYCEFERVSLFDVHSDVATLLIHNSINHDNSRLVGKYDKPGAVLICPDAGAAKKIDRYLEWNKNLLDVVYCIKKRDLSNGEITLKVLEPEKCAMRNCVIIDDICDGGATFVKIAEQIKPAHLTLIVSHGIFSKSTGWLLNYFDHIITSDSYRDLGNWDKLTTVNLGL